MFAVDTNLFLYAVDELSPYHRRGVELLEKWRSQTPAWYIAWGTIYEFLRVATHPKVFRQPLTPLQAWAFIEVILESPGCRLLVAGTGHAQLLKTCLAEVTHLRGNLFHDFHTAVLMREYGVRTIQTNDMDFHRFPWVDVVNPLA